MARFYFNFVQDGQITLDEDGSDFGSFEEAYLSAFHTAQEMWRDLLIERQDPRRCSFEVTDAQGHSLFVLPFTEVLDVCTLSSKSPAPESRALVLKTARQSHSSVLRSHAEVKGQISQARAAILESFALLQKFDR